MFEFKNSQFFIISNLFFLLSRMTRQSCSFENKIEPNLLISFPCGMGIRYSRLPSLLGETLSFMVFFFAASQGPAFAQ